MTSTTSRRLAVRTTIRLDLPPPRLSALAAIPSFQQLGERRLDTDFDSDRFIAERYGTACENYDEAFVSALTQFPGDYALLTHLAREVNFSDHYVWSRRHVYEPGSGGHGTHYESHRVVRSFISEEADVRLGSRQAVYRLLRIVERTLLWGKHDARSGDPHGAYDGIITQLPPAQHLHYPHSLSPRCIADIAGCMTPGDRSAALLLLPRPICARLAVQYEMACITPPLTLFPSDHLTVPGYWNDPIWGQQCALLIDTRSERIVIPQWAPLLKSPTHGGSRESLVFFHSVAVKVPDTMRLLYGIR